MKHSVTIDLAFSSVSSIIVTVLAMVRKWPAHTLALYTCQKYNNMSQTYTKFFLLCNNILFCNIRVVKSSTSSALYHLLIVNVFECLILAGLCCDQHRHKLQALGIHQFLESARIQSFNSLRV